MNSYIEVTFLDVPSEISEILVATLADIDYEGFEESDKELKAFIPKEKYDESLINSLSGEYPIKFVVREIEPANWNKVWESNFQPVVVNDFAAVRAEFHDVIPGVKHEIIITPKMSFGTGHHATTKMMMEQMADIDFTEKSVFDFGTGTGILAILAEKLGAREVFAIDNDPWSIENAEENFQRNNCVIAKVKLSDTAQQGRKFDVILANIIKTVILHNLDFLTQQLNQDGVLLVSGLLPEDEADILEAAKKRSLNVERKMQENNWICLSFRY